MTDTIKKLFADSRSNQWTFEQNMQVAQSAVLIATKYHQQLGHDEQMIRLIVLSYLCTQNERYFFGACQQESLQKLLSQLTSIYCREDYSQITVPQAFRMDLGEVEQKLLLLCLKLIQLRTAIYYKTTVDPVKDREECLRYIDRLIEFGKVLVDRSPGQKDNTTYLRMIIHTSPLHYTEDQQKIQTHIGKAKLLAYTGWNITFTLGEIVAQICVTKINLMSEKHGDLLGYIVDNPKRMSELLEYFLWFDSKSYYLHFCSAYTILSQKNYHRAVLKLATACTLTPDDFHAKAEYMYLSAVWLDWLFNLDIDRYRRIFDTEYSKFQYTESYQPGTDDVTIHLNNMRFVMKEAYRLERLIREKNTKIDVASKDQALKALKSIEVKMEDIKNTPEILWDSVCAYCGVSGVDKQLKKCTKCQGNTYYCCREHQKLDTYIHKTLCAERQQKNHTTI